MSESTEGTSPRYFLRRVHSGQWSPRKKRASSEAFTVKEPGGGLSLFREDLQTPEGTIKHAIDAEIKRLESEDESEREKARQRLEKNGQTVAEWLAKGWRVVKVPIAAFVERGYTFDEPDEAGHLNAFGDHDLHAPALAGMTVLVFPRPPDA